MRKDFSKVPTSVTIKNTTENKIILELSDLSGVFEQVPATIEAGEVLILNVKTSEALAALTHRVEDAGIKMTVKESGGDEPEPEKPTEVATEEDLKQAIANGDKEVKLTDNITVASGNLNLGTTQHFDGNGKTISFETTGQNLVSTHSGTIIENVIVENTVATEDWSSTYGIQCYNGDYTIKNVTAKGGNAGILVNSANVTFEGTIDVSGNKFGGIEVSKSSNTQLQPSTLNINGATIVNTTEEFRKPTIWIDGVEDGNVVNGAESMFATTELVENQIQYYLEEKYSKFPEIVGPGEGSGDDDEEEKQPVVPGEDGEEQVTTKPDQGDEGTDVMEPVD